MEDQANHKILVNREDTVKTREKLALRVVKESVMKPEGTNVMETYIITVVDTAMVAVINETTKINSLTGQTIV